MLSGRSFDCLAQAQLQASQQLAACLARLDDVVDVAPLGRGIRVGVLLGVLGDELETALRAAIKDFRSNFVPSEGAAAFKEKPAEALTDEEKEALKKFRRPTPDEIREKAGPAGESSVQLPG